MPRPKGSKNKTPAGMRVNAIVSAEVAQWLKSTGDITGTIKRLCEDEMGKQEKQHYYAILKNDQGASMNGPHGTSINAVVADVREHYSGWKVEVYRAEINGERTLVKEFQLR